MRELDLTQAELAERLNAALALLTGAYGKVSDRRVREMLDGTTRWPHPKTRLALADVLGRPPEQLGFLPPKSARPPEQPVRRRAFLTSTTGAATAAAIPALATPLAADTGDVLRLRTRLAELTSLDQDKGGHRALEAAALTGASHALDLHRGRASEKIHQRLLGVAADFTATAAFSAFDSHRLSEAERLLDRAGKLAGLSQDSSIQMRVWISTAMLAQEREKPGDQADAIAAAHAALATSTARRDPFFASLGHARLSVAYANARDRQAALRSLGLAGDALARAVPDPDRSAWTGFYGPAELATLTAVTHQLLDEPELAEAASHRALSAIPPIFRRNRGLATARLALAQLEQREVEAACSTAHGVFDVMDGDPLPGRMRTVLGDFQRQLITTAPGVPAAATWTERARREWNRPS